MAYPLAVGIVECFQFNNIWMSDNPHDLQFTVLDEVSLAAPS